MWAVAVCSMGCGLWPHTSQQFDNSILNRHSPNTTFQRGKDHFWFCLMLCICHCLRPICQYQTNQAQPTRIVGTKKRIKIRYTCRHLRQLSKKVVSLYSRYSTKRGKDHW